MKKILYFCSLKFYFRLRKTYYIQMTTTSDIVLMQQLKKGSETALRELIDRYRRGLYRLAISLLSDRAAADDAVQETFIRLWSHARRYDSRHTVSTWLYTICARRCYDELRRRRRHSKAVEQLELPISGAGGMDEESILAVLRQVVASLPTKQRVVYQLREIECLDAESTAEALRMTVDQVKSNLWNARNTVREKLKQYGI